MMTVSPSPLRARSCPCCGASSQRSELGLISPFLARRALLRDPEPVELARCLECGHAWSLRGLSEQEATRLYTGYRGQAYYEARRATEPWYTRAVNDAIGSESAMQDRRAVLAGALAAAAAQSGPRPQGRCLDFGGDRGQMLKDLPDADKLVYEVSGVDLEPWARRLVSLASEAASFDLVLNCQVLEHVNDPLAALRETAAMARPGGWLYVEVPDERWRSLGARPSRARERWLRTVARSTRATVALDFLSTACRIKLHWTPPGGFWAMREHINFFSPQSLSLLARQAGLTPIFLQLTASGISMVAVKSGD
jgi:SAM-dependent methyltransferase